MATGKRFYWMKLKDSFMTSDTIDYFMSQPNGANYVVLYQMLCLKTINTGGRLSRQIGEVIIPFDVDKIVRDCKWFSVDTVRVALELYKAFGLVYEDTDGTLVLSNHNELVGSETDWAERKRVQRGTEPKKLGMDNFHTNVHEENRDKEIKRLDNRDKELRDNTPPLSPPHGEPTPENETNADGIFRLPFDGELGETVKDWLIYKQERREKYKPAGLKSLCTQIQNSVNEYGEQAVMTVIRESMASGYKGIMFDRLKQKANYKKDEGWSWDDFR